VITVMEVWHLKPHLADDALAVMQKMDDMVGPPAHEHPGWCGHARFYQSAACPADVVMIYPWVSRQLHEGLTASEEPALTGFYEAYCTARREIYYYTELPVDVEHDDETHVPAESKRVHG
jgi:hypothetical protein